MQVYLYLKSAMSKFKLSSKKLSLVKVLSLGIIVLGLGCISWSLINIWSQPKNSYDEATDNIEYSSESDFYDKSTVIYRAHRLCLWDFCLFKKEWKKVEKRH